MNSGGTEPSNPSVADNEKDEHIAMLNKMKGNDTGDFEAIVNKDVRKTGVRWIMLFMACNFLLGSYYCYDIPAAIESSFRKDFDNMDASTYAL